MVAELTEDEHLLARRQADATELLGEAETEEAELAQLGPQRRVGIADRAMLAQPVDRASPARKLLMVSTIWV
ncbi:hypothetical protein ACFSTI_15905 [Rhizorhabdus histidinilytica]